MERRVLYMWVIAISFIGILCIFTLGRPTGDVPTIPVAAGYTPAPGGTYAPTAVAQLVAGAVVSSAVTTAPMPMPTLTPVVDPRNQTPELMPTTPATSAGAAGGAITLAPYLRHAQRIRLQSDALATPFVLSRHRAHSPMLQLAHHKLLQDAEYAAVA